ncbi:MAG: GNAT family N-acetyltransferase [Anaerolineae bacterium]|nr:GNAT family N-acetyltransferase [Anaerolineae bacterium]
MTPENIDFEIAQEADIPQIRAAAAESWHVTYKDIFTAEFIDDFLQRAYAAESLRGVIQNPQHAFLVAKDNGRVVGYCHFGQGEEGSELFRLYVVPGYQRRGIGQRFLRWMEARLRAQGVTEYFCYVHSQNKTGQAFYLKNGFAYDGAHDEEGTSCEWCMRKEIAAR